MGDDDLDLVHMGHHRNTTTGVAGCFQGGAGCRGIFRQA
jgi:hypothetical protein